MALVLRGDKATKLDNYAEALLLISSRCEPSFGAMGMTGYVYQSIKDSIKDFKLKVKDFRKEIATIGRYVGMSEDSFSRMLNDSYMDNITKEDIENAIKKAKK